MVQEPTVTELLNELMENGYLFLKYVPSRGVCGLGRTAYTMGLYYGMGFNYYQGRYCYESKFKALQDLMTWSGTGDPPGNWIQHKGGTGEYSNPNYIKE